MPVWVKLSWQDALILAENMLLQFAVTDILD